MLIPLFSSVALLGREKISVNLTWSRITRFIGYQWKLYVPPGRFCDVFNNLRSG